MNPDKDLANGWTQHRSNRTGKPYYVNKYTRKSQWYKPTEPATYAPPKITHVRSSSPYAPVKTPSGTPVQEKRYSHILIKHIESRRPSSWRRSEITRTKADALVVIKDLRSKIMSGELTFNEIAWVYSDCDTAKCYGDLGPFHKNQMPKQCESIALQMKVDQLSDPVETSSGYHLILRTA